MASTSLQLASSKAEKSRIICQLTDGRDTRIKISSDLSVKKKHWSTSSNKVLSADLDAVAKNKSLAILKKAVLEIYLELKSKRVKVDAAKIREQLKTQNESEKKVVEDDVIKQLEIYLKAKTNKSSDFIRTAKPVIQHLSHYIKTRKINTLKFDALNKPFLEGYEHYLSQEQHEYVWKGKAVKKSCLKSGTVNRHFTHLKILCKNLMGELPINNAIFLHTVTEINEESRVLNWNELKLIIDAPTATDKQQLSKDIFQFSFFSGMRISTVQELRPGDIHGGFIHWINTKSKKQPTVQTTIHKYNYGIIKKYKALKGSKLFPPISQQRMNVNIKTICKSVGIERPEEIHNHTGRHAYNSLLYVLGIDVFVRNEELGHAHGNINQQVYTSLDENERKTLIVNTMKNLETLLAQKQGATSEFDDL